MPGENMLENPIPWPDGNRCAVSVTWDVDADSGLNYYNRDKADNLVASQSQTRYDPLIAVPRLARLLRRLEMRQTFFFPGWCIEKYPAAVDMLLKDGHEIALHGYLHERPNEVSAKDELYWLQRGIGAFERRVGRRPAGWRAPSFAFSKHSLAYLIAENFAYDSSLMGDEIPYRLHHSSGSLLELPVDWALDDWPHYMHNRDFRFMMPISAPARAMEVFRAEFDAAWRHGAMWISVWHPFVSARLSRLDAVIDLIAHMRDKGGVWFAPLGDIARHVESLVASGKWKPREEHLPIYESPIPEFEKIDLSSRRKSGRKS
jgi:peptidoglycan/xylan/chitin deacetylase (PgdA/CDA1 family)